jgi:predicted short-subunit dehydrogenase-like oxidoreductase (DUF2520 family)
LSEMIRPSPAWEKIRKRFLPPRAPVSHVKGRRHLTIFAPSGDNGESEGCIHQRIHPGMVFYVSSTSVRPVGARIILR